MKSDEQIAIEKMRDAIAHCAVFFNKIRDRIPEEDEAFKAADDSVNAIITACVSPSGIMSADTQHGNRGGNDARNHSVPGEGGK